MSEWVVTLRSTKYTLMDVRLKTGSMLLRKWYIEKLREIAEVQRLKIHVFSPEGINKLPSSYFVVQMDNPTDSNSALGLFEYHSGGLRLVGLDNPKLASLSGNEILAFFETPIHTEQQSLKIKLFESSK